MTIPAVSSHAQCSIAELAERVARALNLLGADGDLLGTADTDALLELIDDYLAEDDEPVDNQGNPTH